MKIAYVAKHGSGGGDDELAIAWALEQLGHEVLALPERDGTHGHDADLLLFHKWDDVVAIESYRCPRVFWYFDLVTFPDPSLRARCMVREAWFRAVLPHVDLGFCTDGDWVATNDRLVFLPQGFDSRLQAAASVVQDVPILFTGIGRGGGEQRLSFVREMTDRYGNAFNHIQRGTYREALAQWVSQSKIVVAPDSPVTDKYCSNRIYNMLGLGAFLLHPYCKFLEAYYRDFEEIVYYHGRADLHEKIAYFMERPVARATISAAGRARTLAEHTYLHRCQVLLAVVKERLGVGC